MTTKAFDIFNAKVNKYFAQGMSEQDARAAATQEMRTNPNIMNALKSETLRTNQQSGGDWKSTVLNLAGTMATPQGETTEEESTETVETAPSSTDETLKKAEAYADFMGKYGLDKFTTESAPVVTQTKQAFKSMETPVQPYDPAVIQSAFGGAYQYPAPTRGFINAIRKIRNEVEKSGLKNEEAQILKDIKEKFSFDKAEAMAKSSGGSGGSGGGKDTRNYKKEFDETISDYATVKKAADGFIVSQINNAVGLVDSGVGKLLQAIDDRSEKDIDAIGQSLLNIMDSGMWITQASGTEGLGSKEAALAWKEKRIQQIKAAYYRKYLSESGNSDNKKNQSEAYNKAEEHVNMLLTGKVNVSGIKVVDDKKVKEIRGLMDKDLDAAYAEIKKTPYILDALLEGGYIKKDMYDIIKTELGIK